MCVEMISNPCTTLPHPFDGYQNVGMAEHGNEDEVGKLTGKVAVVTGASKGIGASIAEHLAAEGASVVVNYASSKSGADAVVDRISKAGGKAVAIGGSVAEPAEITKLIDETKKAYGKIDILVNNAGVFDFAPL